MPSLPDTLCYLNGEYLPLSEAKVSVLDRGFVFGDGIYEVVPVYAQRLFRFEEHMARLGRSLAKVRIANPLREDEWLARARRLIADPRSAGRTIGDIALEAGFGDLSYFNRAFRRRFGDTPSGIRADAYAGSMQDLA